MSFVGTVALLIAALSTAFSGYQIMATRREAADARAWRKRERAAEFSVFRHPEYREAAERLKEAFGLLAGRKGPIPAAEITAALKKHPALNEAIFTTLAHWERMSVEVELGLIDEDAAYAYHATLMTNAYFAFSDFVRRRLEANPLSFPHLRAIGERWVQRRHGKTPARSARG